jgi:hypothetical protein
MENNIYNYGFDKSLNKDAGIVPSFNDSFQGSYDTQPLILEKNTSTGIKNIFSIIPGGEDEGDVVIGDYEGLAGILYDKSANNTIFKGTITGGVFQTATSGQRIVIDGNTNSLVLYKTGTDEAFSLGGNFSNLVFLAKVFSGEVDKSVGVCENAGTGYAIRALITNAANNYTGIQISQGGTGAHIRVNDLTVDPTGNDAVVGDLAVVGGKLKICTVAGSPGTFTEVGPSPVYPPLYGDGSDGDVTISVDTTLASNKYYNNLTINSGKVLNTGGYVIFVKGTLTVNGILMRNGNNGGNGGNGGNATSSAAGAGGTAGAAGAALADGFLKGTLAGVAGAAGANGVRIAASGLAVNGSDGNTGTAGSNTTHSEGVNGVASQDSQAGGGSGSGSGLGGNGQSGVAGGTVTASLFKTRDITNLVPLFDYDVLTHYQITSSASSGGAPSGGSGGAWCINETGGASAASGGSGGAGGSGSPGGIVVVIAKAIVVGSGGKIQVNGGNGGNGGNAGAAYATNSQNRAGGSCGGNSGSGGSGGVLILAYSTLTNAGTIEAAGGTYGTIGVHSDGTVGAPAYSNDGNVGIAGSTGTLIQITI